MPGSLWPGEAVSVLSVKEMCERLWRLEREHQLLDHEIAGVRVWQLLRMVIYYKIAREAGVFAEPHAEKQGLLNAIRAAGVLITAITRSPLRGDYQREYLVFDHARKPLVDGRHVDIYTEGLLRTLPPGSYDVLESLYLGKHLERPEPNRRFLDAVTIGSFVYHVTHYVRFSPEERDWIRRVEAGIQREFGVSIQLGAIFRREINHYRFATAYYRKLLQKRRPRQIFLVVSYSFYKRPLLALAKELGIETIEIQHGTLSPYHLGYSFPETEGELEHFPTTFYSFGDYWRTAARLPLPPERIKTYGFPHFTRQRAQFADIARRPDQVLFISQGVIGPGLADFALKVARRLPECRVVYKLHPGEVDGWRRKYPGLAAAASLANVEVVERSERPLYAWFAESAFQVGVFSTALYEGLAFGCRTFIVDLPGAEYMQDLIDRNIVQRVANAEDFVRLKSGPPAQTFNSEYFFASSPG